jgi:membrane protein YqaA with SNARE-associated domain
VDKFVESLQSYGEIGLFIHAFLDAVIFPIPAFFTQLSLSALQPDAALWLATCGFIGCLLGTPIGYAIGKSGNALFNRIVKKKWLDSAAELFKRHGETAILIGSFTPIPFKIFTILSGVMNYPLWKLMSYAALGRAAKFYVVGILFHLYGRAAERMVGQTFTIALLAAGAVIAVVWAIINRWLKQRKRNRNIHRMETEKIVQDQAQITEEPFTQK